MPNVSKEFFLADRNPSNWTLTVTEPVEEEEVATVVAINKITESEFTGTVAEFNDYLAVVLGDAHKPENVYDLVTGALSTVAGPTGPQGPAGPQGIQGIKGDKGDTGNAGASTAADVSVNTASFAGNLTAADDTVQKALVTLDALTTGGGGGGIRGFFQTNKLTDENFPFSTQTKVTCNEVVDQEGWFSSSRYTPQIAGWYRFDTVVWLNAPNIMTDAQVTITKNGGGAATGVSSYSHRGASTDRIIPVSGVLYMNGTTDYAEVAVYIETTAVPPKVLAAAFSFSGSLLYPQ